MLTHHSRTMTRGRIWKSPHRATFHFLVESQAHIQVCLSSAEGRQMWPLNVMCPRRPSVPRLCFIYSPLKSSLPIFLSTTFENRFYFILIFFWKEGEHFSLSAPQFSFLKLEIQASISQNGRESEHLVYRLPAASSHVCRRPVLLSGHLL